MRGVIAFALIISVSASAECKKDDFNRYVAAAVRLYEGLEYERAIDQIVKAKEFSCGVHDDAVLGLYEGIVRSDLGEAEKAKIAFKEALLLEPDAELPLKVSPKTKKLVELLRADAKKELAPIRAKQEAERVKQLADENARAEKARQEEEARRAADDARRAEDARKAEELRVAQQNAKNEEERRRLAEEARKLEQERQARERAIADRPVNRDLTPPPREEPPPLVTKTRRAFPVVSVVFGAAGLLAGGIGAYFGVTSRSGVTTAMGITNDQAMRQQALNNAGTNAIIADVLFGVAGVAAIAAVIALIVNPSEVVTEPSR